MWGEDWACCYVLVAGRSLAEVAAMLAGGLSGRMLSEAQASDLSAPWPAVGPAGEGWSVLSDPHFEFGDADLALRQWSIGARVVSLQVIAGELFSHAVVWADGEHKWGVSFEGQLDERPIVSGRFPYNLEALATTVDAEGGPASWFGVAVVAVELATGWRPLSGNNLNRQLFAELTYPRLENVAAWVARDLGEIPPR